MKRFALLFILATLSMPPAGAQPIYNQYSPGWFNCGGMYTTVDAQTGTTYTVGIGDSNTCVTMSNASANTLTIPLNSAVSFPVGTQIQVEQLGAGITSVAAASGVTFNSNVANPQTATGITLAQYGKLLLRKSAVNTWEINSSAANVLGRVVITSPTTNNAAITAANIELQQGSNINLAIGSGVQSNGSPSGTALCTVQNGSATGRYYSEVTTFGGSGDLFWCSGVGNPTLEYQMKNNTVNGSLTTMTTNTNNDGLYWGVSTAATTSCDGAFGFLNASPAYAGPCSVFTGDIGENGLPLLFPDGFGTVELGILLDEIDMNIGHTTPVSVMRAKSANDDDVQLTLGDKTASTSALHLQGGSAGGVTVTDSAGNAFQVGYLGTPLDTQTGSTYTLALADRGKTINFENTGTITIPDSTFAAGDVVTILINASGTVTLAEGGTVVILWANGTTGSTGNRTLTGYALVTLVFTATNRVFISGSGIS